jgi:hypothetical protein
MPNIYDCTGLPGTNHFSRIYNDTAFLGLKFMVRVMLFPMINILCLDINTFRRMCAVHNIAVCVVSLLLLLLLPTRYHITSPQFMTSSFSNCPPAR